MKIDLPIRSRNAICDQVESSTMNAMNRTLINGRTTQSGIENLPFLPNFKDSGNSIRTVISAEAPARLRRFSPWGVPSLAQLMVRLAWSAIGDSSVETVAFRFVFPGVVLKVLPESWSKHILRIDVVLRFQYVAQYGRCFRTIGKTERWRISENVGAKADDKDSLAMLRHPMFRIQNLRVNRVTQFLKPIMDRSPRIAFVVRFQVRSSDGQGTSRWLQPDVQSSISVSPVCRQGETGCGFSVSGKLQACSW